MQTTRVTASEFQQRFGTLSDEAWDQPVIITRHGQDALVVVSIEEWARLSDRDRTVGRAEDLGEAWLDAVIKADMPAAHAHLDSELE